MKLLKGNLWDSADEFILVTANSFITKAGYLVMGRGAALELSNKVPGIDHSFGAKIKTCYGHLGKYGLLYESTPYNKLGYFYGIFQVKYHFRDKADLDLIKYSTELLNKLAINSTARVSMNFPGIGCGQLSREVVLPIISMLPDNVTVYEYGT